MRSLTQNDFAKQIERDDMRRNAVGLRKGSKSAVRDKRYGGGKRSSRGMQQIQQQYMQPSAPMIYNGGSGSKSVGGRRKRS